MLPKMVTPVNVKVEQKEGSASKVRAQQSPPALRVLN